MAKSMDIPQDIIDNVIEAVGDDRPLLKQCALVSSSFLLPSRKKLFSKISIGSDQSCQRIHQILVQNPAIQSSVRTITLNVKSKVACWDFNPSQWMNNSTELLAILRLQFCCLECFSIVSRENWNWNKFSSEMKDALSNIMHSSTLKSLSITRITELPITFFLYNVHLPALELFSITPHDFDGESSSSLMLAASKGVAPQAMAIDRCMWSFGESYWPASYEIPFICFFSLIQYREGSTGIPRPLIRHSCHS